MKRIILIAAAALVSFAASAQDFKFGYVDFTEIIQLMPEMDSARVQIDAASAEAQETYQAMVEDIRQKLGFTSLQYARLDDIVESIGLSPCKLCTYCWSGKE